MTCTDSGPKARNNTNGRLLKTVSAVASAGATLLTAGTAFGWCYEKEWAADGTEIAWDYQIFQGYSRFQGSYWARLDNYIHVRNPALTGSEKVVLVVVDYDQNGRELGARDFTMGYNPDKGEFTTKAADLTIVTAAWGSSQYNEVAVAINDEWLKVPGSWKSNFVFDARSARGYCHQE